MDEVKTPSVIINEIKFKNGQQLTLKKDDIVLLVGANNVGKSRTLKDIRDDLYQLDLQKVLIDEIKYSDKGFSEEQMQSFFERNISKDDFGNYNVSTGYNSTHSFNKENFKNLSDDSSNEEKRTFYKALFSFLSTENRLDITKPIVFNYNVDRNALNILMRLEENEYYIEALNNVLGLSFEKAIEVYEYYSGENSVKKYKIGDSDYVIDAINSSNRDCKNKLKNADDLHDQGDGIRNAVAVLASFIVNEHSLFLIDEPETFLHPPQARTIGKNIVELSENKQCFISTHNIDFIRGVLEADSSRVKIIKIDRSENDNSFHLVDNEIITKISQDKNLKYTNILNGLFYKQLVLCEDESDCKFYSAILENVCPETYQNTLFCAVGGKYQFKKVVPLLKELKIRYKVIADIDLINNNNELKKLLDVIEEGSYAKIENEHINFLEKFEEGTNSQVKTQETIKEEIEKVFNKAKYMSPDSVSRIKDILKDATKISVLKKGGKSILPSGECVKSFESVKGFLMEHGIFILDCGEIERLVPTVAGHGDAWVEKVFSEHQNIEDGVYGEARKFIEDVFSYDMKE